MWAECLPVEEVTGPKVPVEDVDVRLARMLESQSLPTTTQRSYTEEEKRIKEAILAQYSQMSEDENSGEDGEEDGASGGDCGIEKNTNAATIIQQEREKREKAKLESQRKKEKDKEDRYEFNKLFIIHDRVISTLLLINMFSFREKQKQLREEKKEKRKTQKGERRR